MFTDLGTVLLKYLLSLRWRRRRSSGSRNSRSSVGLRHGMMIGEEE
jgi:hypothetical protein